MWVWHDANTTVGGFMSRLILAVVLGASAVCAQDAQLASERSPCSTTLLGLSFRRADAVLLAVDSREAIMQGGNRGPAIVAGNASQSRLVQAIRRTGDLATPPGRNGRPPEPVPPGFLAALGGGRVPTPPIEATTSGGTHRTRELDRDSGQSPVCAGDGQSHLALSFRPRPGRHSERSGTPRRTAVASGRSLERATTSVCVRLSRPTMSTT